MSSVLRSGGRRLRDSGLLTLLAWVGVIGLLFADSMFVQDHSTIPYASVVVGAITMTPIALLLLGFPPLAGWGVSALTAILYPLVAVMPNPNIWPYTPLQLLVAAAVLIAVGWRYRLPMLLVVFAGTALAISIGVNVTGDTSVETAGLAFGVAVALVLGRLAGARRRADATASERGRQLEAEASRRMLLEERARIARELHDVVAHHMSVIAVQAETAPYRVGRLSEEARGAFGQIAADARNGLAEMRRLLGVLRHDEAAGSRPADSVGSPLMQPQPDLADLSSLIDTTTRAGITARLVVADDVGPVSGAVGLTAYRVVQESLSNVVRHAPGADVLVTVGRTNGDLVLEIRNGRSTSQSTEPERPVQPGQGLKGMRERVVLLDGTLTVSRQPGGGFLVRARLPDTVGTDPPSAATTQAVT